MVTKAPSAEAAPCYALTDEQHDLAREVVTRAATNWALWVLSELDDAGAPLRFARLMERVEGVSQKMLTQTLRSLERDGMVTRTLFAQVPPRVDYALTPMGKAFLDHARPAWRFVVRNVAFFEAAREAYAKGKPAPQALAAE